MRYIVLVPRSSAAIRSALALGCALAVGCSLDTQGQDASGAANGGAATSNGAGATGATASGASGGAGATGAGSPASTGPGSSTGSGSGGSGGEPVSCGAGSVCVPAVPAGWEGHFHLRRTGYPDPSPPSCPDGSGAVLTSDGPADAQCSACTCGALQGAACAVNVTYWLSSSCTGTVSSESYLLDQGYACYNWPNTFSGLLSGKLDGYVVVDQGSCAPSTAQLVNPTPWQTQDAACPAAVGAGACDGGDVCVSSGNADYGGLCVRQTGAAACPPGWGDPILTYGSFSDTRGCGGCGCAPSTQCSGGTVTLYDSDACSGVSTTLGNQCKALDDFIDGGSGSESAVKPTAGGSCSPSGGASTGALVPADPVTYCCK
jgi:hypothetical protein